MTEHTPAPDAAFATTKILALGTLRANVTKAELDRVMPEEVTATVRLYLDGTIDQWFARKGGVMFLLNMQELATAQARLDELPLAQAGLMHFDLTALGPLFPLAGLLKS